MQAIEESGLDAKVTLADRLLLTHIARLNNDYTPASDPFRVTLARLIDATKLNAGHIKRRLCALDKKDTIRLARSEGRYKPEYDITIIAPDYNNAAGTSGQRAQHEAQQRKRTARPAHSGDRAGCAFPRDRAGCAFPERDRAGCAFPERDRAGCAFPQYKERS